MQNGEKRKRILSGVQIAVILLLCACTLLLDFLPIAPFEEDFYNGILTKITQQLLGSIAGILLLIRLKIKLFGKAEGWIYLLPCLLVALNNFQWHSYFSGNMTLVRTNPLDFLLFFLQCMSVGLFEEIIFRGILLSLIAGLFTRDKKGFLWTYVLSSLLFGLMHLFSGSVLQAGYSILTGGLFAFCLLKTKNIFFPAFIHGLYNFCGLLMDRKGLGAGVVFDAGTASCMLIVGVLVGIFVLYKVWTASEEERGAFYRRLGVENQKK